MKDETGKEVEVSDNEEEEEKKEEEPKHEAIEEETVEAENDDKIVATEQITETPSDPKELLKKLETPARTLDLAAIDAEEARLESASTQSSEFTQRALLDGFAQANVKFHLLSGSLEKLQTKKKYAGLFDIGVLSVNSANQITKGISTLFKDGASVHCETADYMVILKPEQREEFRKKIIEKVRDARWTVQ